MFDLKKSTVISLAVFFLLLDRFLKTIAVSLHSIFPLYGSIFRFNFVPNPYIAFSLPLGGILLNILTALLITWLIYELILSFKQNLFFSSLGLLLIVLGASSNLLDRLKFGFVIDYLDLKYFTIFNLADVMIFTGVMLVLIINLRNPDKKTNP